MSLKNNHKIMISRITDPNGTMEEKLFDIAAISSSVIQLLNLIAMFFFRVRPELLIIAGAVLLLSLAISLISYKAKAFRGGYTVLCLLINIILIPCVFIFCGGFHSGRPVYMVLGVVLCGCHPSHRSGQLTAGVAAVVYALLFVLVVLRPDMIHPIPEYAVIPDISGALFIGTVMVMMLTGFYLSFYRNMNEKNMKDYEQKTEMRTALLESQIENIEDVKRLRHNMRHHNSIISEYAEKHDLKGLRNYLREKQYSDEFYSKRLYCMNVSVNNILTIYDRIAQNKGVEMSIDADVKSEAKIDENDLNNMISTVLENAINGALTSGREDKKVRLEIRERGHRLVVNCRNTCSRMLKDMSEYPGFPGTGIEAVERTLDSVGGILDYSIENGEVICRLIVDAF